MTSKSFFYQKQEYSFEKAFTGSTGLNLQFSNFDPLTPKQTRIACIPDLLISEVKKFFYQKKPVLEL